MAIKRGKSVADEVGLLAGDAVEEAAESREARKKLKREKKREREEVKNEAEKEYPPEKEKVKAKIGEVINDGNGGEIKAEKTTKVKGKKAGTANKDSSKRGRMEGENGVENVVNQERVDSESKKSKKSKKVTENVEGAEAVQKKAKKEKKKRKGLIEEEVNREELEKEELPRGKVRLLEVALGAGADGNKGVAKKKAKEAVGRRADQEEGQQGAAQTKKNKKGEGEGQAGLRSKAIVDGVTAGMEGGGRRRKVEETAVEVGEGEDVGGGGATAGKKGGGKRQKVDGTAGEASGSEVGAGAAEGATAGEKRRKKRKAEANGDATAGKAGAKKGGAEVADGAPGGGKGADGVAAAGKKARKKLKEGNADVAREAPACGDPDKDKKVVTGGKSKGTRRKGGGEEEVISANTREGGDGEGVKEKTAGKKRTAEGVTGGILGVGKKKGLGSEDKDKNVDKQKKTESENLDKGKIMKGEQKKPKKEGVFIDVIVEKEPEKTKKEKKATGSKKRTFNLEDLPKNVLTGTKVANWKKGDDEKNIKFGFFSAEEDAIIVAAVYEYVAAKGWTVEEGIANILNCRKVPEARGVFQEITASLPNRVPRSVRFRVKKLFDDSYYVGVWSEEETETLKRLFAEHGPKWSKLSKLMGRADESLKYKWRDLGEGREIVTGKWSQEEMAKLCRLVQTQLREKEESISTHNVGGRVVRDDINWGFISREMNRRQVSCVTQWYYKLAPFMVMEGQWGNRDDRHLLKALLDAGADGEDEVDWGAMVEGRSAEVCLMRWKQMRRHLPGGYLTLEERIEKAMERFAPELLESCQVAPREGSAGT